MAGDWMEARAVREQAEATIELATAYTKRTEQMGKSAYADRQAKARADALKIAFDVLDSQLPGAHTGVDLMNLADTLAAYILTGAKTADTPPPPFPGVRT